MAWGVAVGPWYLHMTTAELANFIEEWDEHYLPPVSLVIGGSKSIPRAWLQPESRMLTLSGKEIS